MNTDSTLCARSGFGFGGCDLDLGIYFEEMDVDCQGQFSPQERIQILTTAVSRLSGTFTIKQFIRNARVPIIKLWDAKRKVRSRSKDAFWVDGQRTDNDLCCLGIRSRVISVWAK